MTKQEFMGRLDERCRELRQYRPALAAKEIQSTQVLALAELVYELIAAKEGETP